MKPAVFISKKSFSFNIGTIIKEYTNLENGILTESKEFISKDSIILLTEKLSTDDEKRIKQIISQQLHMLFWNLYNKQGMLISNN